MVLTKRTCNLPLICQICGDVARGINFEVMSCMSCKAFFRRHALQPQVTTSTGIARIDLTLALDLVEFSPMSFEQ